MRCERGTWKAMNRTDIASRTFPGPEERRSVAWVECRAQPGVLVTPHHRFDGGMPTCAGVPPDPNEGRILFPKMKETDHE
jgi:hypothetical protein